MTATVAPRAPKRGATKTKKSGTSYVFTSESVSEGHPDKVCDYIADSILDAHLASDPKSRVACEVLVKSGDVVLAGEITSTATVNFEAVAREAIREIGYTDPSESFNADGTKVLQFVSRQSGEIGQGVDVGGAGDQGIMFGYATDETAELMPLPILLAHKLAKRLADARKSKQVSWLRPDAKTQVSVEYENNVPVAVRTVLVSTMHARDVSQTDIGNYVASTLCPEVLGPWYQSDIEVRSLGRVLLPIRRASDCKARARETRRGSSRLRDRTCRPGVRACRHVRNGQRPRRRRAGAHLRLPPSGDHRAARPAAADLSSVDELRSFRAVRTVLGSVMFSAAAARC
jgi:S-adenosylmethionine synthetase family protein